MLTNTRTAERLDGFGKWRGILPIDIKEGMIFRLAEQDGTDVISSNGSKMFIACSDAYINEDGVAVINVLNEETMQKPTTTIIQGLKDGLNSVYGLSSVRKWISVMERLPEKPEYDWVLVSAKAVPEDYNVVPYVAELRNGVWWDDHFDGPLEEIASVKVTHWMPLPPVSDEMV